MIRENLQKATEINKEILRLETEIEFLERPYPPRKHWIVRAFKPKKYTVNNYFCSERDIDSINSVIYLNPQECQMLAEFKREEIKKLEEKYKMLDMEEE